MATNNNLMVIKRFINDHRQDLLNAIPIGISISKQRFMDSALLAIANDYKLQQCTPLSIFKSLKESWSLGLEAGTILGHAYLIPYMEKGQMTCHFQLGYKGIMELARRTGKISTIEANVIRENDIVEDEGGDGGHFSIKRGKIGKRGEIIGYYCYIHFKDGSSVWEVMGKDEVIEHKDKFRKAAAYGKDDKSNVWNKNFDTMAMKTVIIKALKYCQLSTGLSEAIIADDLRDTPDLSESGERVLKVKEGLDKKTREQEVRVEVVEEGTDGATATDELSPEETEEAYQRAMANGGMAEVKGKASKQEASPFDATADEVMKF